MPANDRATAVRPNRQVRDLPGCLKYILLLLLLLLLFAEWRMGEFREIRGAGWLLWLVLLIKIILIIGLIILIWLQKHLQCELTGPTGCTEEEPDFANGYMFVRVNGTASGAVFGSYTLEIQKDGDPPIAGVVVYPGGGASGSAPVIAGELGRIKTTSLFDGAYTITLRVYPGGAGSPCEKTISFNLLKAIVYMSRIGGIQAMVPPANANPFDPAAELGGAPVRSIGGSITFKGAAYIYDCAARKIKKYEIRYANVTAPGPEPAQPNRGDPIPAATWPVGQRIVLFEYSNPDQYQPWTRVGMAPMDLINSWNTMTISGVTFYKLNAGGWGSSVSGRISMLLTAEDTTGVTFHDIQHVWLDNRVIIVTIVKLQRLQNGSWVDIPACTDILLSFGTVRVIGIAWDPVIDESWPLTATPNDNFDFYQLTLLKQGSGTWADVTVPLHQGSRVPALPAMPPVPVPTVADAIANPNNYELWQWDLSTLDAGPDPSKAPAPPPPPPYVPPPYPKLYRGEECAYDLRLYATDTTLVSEGTTHWDEFPWPLKIVNDL